MKTETEQHFESIFDRGDARLIENHRLRGCKFINCGLSLTKDISCRTIIRNVQVEACHFNRCFVGPAIFEHSLAKEVSTGDLLIFWGSLFNNVTISGNIGKFKINTIVDPMDRSPSTKIPFDEFRDNFYKSIDWAIDISKARFKGFDVRGIPAHLFILDAETQAVVTRESASLPGWREQISPSNKLWPFMISSFQASTDEDMVLVVPLGAPKEKREALIRDLRELRNLGVALAV